MQQANYFIHAWMERVCLLPCQLPEVSALTTGDRGWDIIWQLNSHRWKLTVHVVHWHCTYHRQKGVVDAESRFRGEVLIRDETDPDLTAFGNMTSWCWLGPTPATQDGLFSWFFYLHKIIPDRTETEKEQDVKSLSAPVMLAMVLFLWICLALLDGLLLYYE